MPNRLATMDWQVDTDIGALQPQSALDVLAQVDRKVLAGELTSLKPMPTGFRVLDGALNGGLRVGDLALIGGAQGVGKTTFAFQMARNVAASGTAAALYLCYEHDEEYLLNRLISMESVDLAGNGHERGLKLADLRTRIINARSDGPVGLLDVLQSDPKASQALARIQQYGQRLFLLKCSAVHTDLTLISQLVEHYRAQHHGELVLFVDYLQKVPVFPEPDDENEKVTRITSGLKELALSQGTPVVALVAADKEGLKAQRLRLHHLRGSSALTYEADVILILNNKYNIIQKVNIEYNMQKAQQYHNWVVFSVEKNRGGRDLVDIEFQKKFEYCAFNPEGGHVQEKLIDERLLRD